LGRILQVEENRSIENFQSKYNRHSCSIHSTLFCFEICSNWNGTAIQNPIEDFLKDKSWKNNYRKLRSPWCNLSFQEIGTVQPFARPKSLFQLWCSEQRMYLRSKWSNGECHKGTLDKDSEGNLWPKIHRLRILTSLLSTSSDFEHMRPIRHSWWNIFPPMREECYPCATISALFKTKNELCD